MNYEDEVAQLRSNRKEAKREIDGVSVSGYCYPEYPFVYQRYSPELDLTSTVEYSISSNGGEHTCVWCGIGTIERWEEAIIQRNRKANNQSLLELID